MSTLTEQQKETFEKFKDCQSEICDLTARQAFTDGFILATRIMVEVMDGMETVKKSNLFCRGCGSVPRPLPFAKNSVK